MSSLIAIRLEQIRSRIAKIAVNREITIVAVSKMQPDDAVVSAYEAGLRDFGENYLDGLERGVALGLPGARWHFIGGLQRNKLRRVAQRADIIQSIDRVALIEGLSRMGDHLPAVMIEVNLTEEPNRHGCPWRDVPSLVDRAQQENLQVEGLMAIGSPVDRDATRLGFRRLAQLASDLQLSQVSMGMSGDLEMAIEEGSTMVRVGSALFGERLHA